MTVIKVTPEQVQAARIEVAAMRSAGLEPDPLVVRISEVAEGRPSSPHGNRIDPQPDQA